jgi:hypothetical protein
VGTDQGIYLSQDTPGLGHVSGLSGVSQVKQVIPNFSMVFPELNNWV